MVFVSPHVVRVSSGQAGRRESARGRASSDEGEEEEDDESDGEEEDEKGEPYFKVDLSLNPRERRVAVRLGCVFCWRDD